MDRFIVREPRVGTALSPQDYNLQGNHPMAYRATAPSNNPNMIPPDTMYYGGYGVEPPYNAERYVGAQHHLNGAPFTPVNQHQHYPSHPEQGQMSGIDSRYLATYSDNNAAFIVNGQQMQNERFQVPMNFGNSYESRSLVAPDRNKSNINVLTTSKSALAPQVPKEIKQKPFESMESRIFQHTSQISAYKKEETGRDIQQKSSNATFPKAPTENAFKDGSQTHALTRSDKVKALHRSGPRVFSGPVEKVLKWHKALQDIGVLLIYEIVAKCVSIRPGESCSKNLVVRDDTGPAMQIVYYEIDFLLPEMKPPCTVRVVGRMMAGTSRLQAFNVRPATGDDVATLSRRAAVAAHHVAKLCKEYGSQLPC